MKRFEKMLCNHDIRNTAKLNNVCLWEIAEKLNISEPTMTRKLRRELPAAEKQKFLSIINDIAAEKQKTNAAL